MIVFPKEIGSARAALDQTGGELRAGGTELQERRRLPGMDGPLVDLRDTEGLRGISWQAGGTLRLGAKLRIAELAANPVLRAKYPGFAAAAGGLATPQIRAVGTLGGNLLQANRCWYFRAPEAGPRCFKRGGEGCAARAGDHLFGAAVDLGPCASVHPSTLGMALLGYDALVEVEGGDDRSVAALLGDGSDPRRDHQLERGALVTAIHLPAPRARERAAYHRAISRARAEWPLVEVMVRLVMAADERRIEMAAVSMGGVAPVPLRLPDVEDALEGRPATDEVFAEAAERARDLADPLPMTEYKVELMAGTVLDVLERARAAPPPIATGDEEKRP